MKKHIIPSLIAVLLGGCIAAAPAFTQDTVAEAKVMFTVTDIDTGAQLYFACAPVGTGQIQTPPRTYKDFDIPANHKLEVSNAVR